MIRRLIAPASLNPFDDRPPSISLFAEERWLLDVVGPLSARKLDYLAECGRLFDAHAALGAACAERLPAAAAAWRQLIESALNDPDKAAFLLASSAYYDGESASASTAATSEQGDTP